MRAQEETSVLAAIQEHRVTAIIRTADRKLARQAMEAAVAGGFRVIEFTLTTPGALSLIEEFASRQGLIVGAGTVMTPAQAREAVGAGARFLVSPIFDPEVVSEASTLGVVSVPGCSTPTEMETAHRHGADLIKVFPEPAGGVDFIRAVRGPLPHLPLFPTAGPTPENFLSYLDAGCVGVGFVRSLFVPEELASGDFNAIQRRSESIIQRLSDWMSRRGTAPEHR